MAIVAADNTQCRFNINAYRMVFVVNKENLLYKRQALHRARQVSSVGAQTPAYFNMDQILYLLFISHAFCFECMSRLALAATGLQCISSRMYTLKRKLMQRGVL